VKRLHFEENGKELYVVPPANPYPRRIPFDNKQDALTTTGGNKK
jgi:hypothetical protein